MEISGTGDPNAGTTDYHTDYLTATYTLICAKCQKDYQSYDPKTTICPQCSKRTPQIYRQCWAILRAEIERGPIMRTRQGILNRMDSIEKQVRG